MKCAGCKGRVVIPDCVDCVGKYAFMDCYLDEIVIPESVTRIENGAFYNCSRCSALAVFNHARMPQRLDGDVFDEFTELGELHVPKGCSDAYKKADVWNRFTVIDDIE